MNYQRSETKTAQSYLIPKVVVQTAPSLELPTAVIQSRRTMEEQNPGWQFVLYDDEAVEEYIRTEYGREVLETYLSIQPKYGAARADLFRYLRIYADGGIYLDLKSRFVAPIEDHIHPTDQFVLAQWSNGPGQVYDSFGLHPDVAHVPGGEYQQWHVIAAPRHPLLGKVVEQVLDNVRNYRPWRFGVARPGVFRTTGPIAYTLAIAPHLDEYPCRLVRTEAELGLQYSIIENYDHLGHFKKHYSQHDSPVVAMPRSAYPLTWVYIAARRIKHRLRKEQEWPPKHPGGG